MYGSKSNKLRNDYHPTLLKIIYCAFITNNKRPCGVRASYLDSLYAGFELNSMSEQLDKLEICNEVCGSTIT